MTAIPLPELTPGAELAPGTVFPADGELAPGAELPVPAEFSFNQATATGWPVPELVAGCLEAGVTTVGLWREPVADHGLARTAELLRTAGLAVSTLCRGGFFERDHWWDDNRRAVEEAHVLGAPVLVLVSGGLPAGSRDLDGARAHIAESIARLAPVAREAGVRLAVEPLHPMFCADRCVISTLEQALAIARDHPDGSVGVVIDTYHLWWDDTVYRRIAQAGEHIAAFQLADWTTPLPEGALTGRVQPGEGCIELTRFWAAVTNAGFRGPVEVELFNAELWARPGREVLDETIAAFAATAERFRTGD